MGADEFIRIEEYADVAYEVDFPDSNGIDPLWVEAQAAAIAEDGVPDDDE